MCELDVVYRQERENGEEKRWVNIGQVFLAGEGGQETVFPGKAPFLVCVSRQRTVSP